MSAPAFTERPYIGTAGWAIRTRHRAEFPGAGSHLECYARRFNAVEINSSFHRPHRRITYERWASSTPPDFRFAVKLPRAITHDLRLANAADPLEGFLEQVTGLGDKLGVLLVQLPPSLAFDLQVADVFFGTLHGLYRGSVACEPRHPTWFSPTAHELLIEHWISRVAADPAIVPAAAEPGAWPDLRYYRLHGSPRVYYSHYEADRIAAYAERIRSAGQRAWCIFDNTAQAAATENALALSAMLAA
jgi:uncharacterized protein YecE (DUF72 family)